MTRSAVRATLKGGPRFVTTFEPDKLQPGRAPDGPASGFTCPRCGGSIWETHSDTLEFECRIGHKLSLGGMLAEHGAGRRATLIEAGRLLAEAAALNRRVARYAAERGHHLAAARLDQEASALEKRSGEVIEMASSTLIGPEQDVD